jgi:hypothetical protein
MQGMHPHLQQSQFHPANNQMVMPHQMQGGGLPQPPPYYGQQRPMQMQSQNYENYNFANQQQHMMMQQQQMFAQQGNPEMMGQRPAYMQQPNQGQIHPRM